MKHSLSDRMHTLATTLTKVIMDGGKLIETGWHIYRRMMTYTPGPEQERRLREAFFMGAEHVLMSQMVGLDPGIEPTEADEKRMELLYKEIEEFHDLMIVKYADRFVKPEGRA